MNKKITRYISIFIMIIFIVVGSFYKLDIKNFDWKFFVICLSFVILNQIIDGPIIDYIVRKNKNYINDRLIINDSFEKIDSTNNWSTYKSLYIEDHTKVNFFEVYKLYYFKDNEFLYERKDAILSKKELKQYYLNKQLKEYIKRDKLSVLRKYKIHKLEINQDNTTHINQNKLDYKNGKFISSNKHNVISKVLSFLKIASYIYAILDISLFNQSYTAIKIIGLVFLLLIELIYVVKEIKETIKLEHKFANCLAKITEHVLNNTSTIDKHNIINRIYNEC